MTATQETTPAQIANLLRSQDVAPVQRQPRQQSGLPSVQNLGPIQQQQGSHDSASNQPQHLSISFAATGELPDTSVNAATLPPPDSPFQPEDTRPVPVNREHQQQDVSKCSPDDALSCPGVSKAAGDHPTKHVQSMPNVVAGSQPQPGMHNSDPRRLTLSDLNARARLLTLSIAEAERTHQTIVAQITARGGQVDPGSAQRLAALKTDIIAKKGNLNKVIAMMNSMRAQQGQIQGGSNAGNQASWTLPTASFENNSQPGRPTLTQNPPQQQQQHLNGIQASPSLLKTQSSPNHLMPQAAVPTRSVSAPHQQAQLGGQHTGVGGPFANQVAMSGSMGGHFPLDMNGPFASSGSLQQGQTGMFSFPPPLDKVRFEHAFRAYCTRKNLNVNLRQLQIDDRPVDLYQLHRNVMLEFGVSKVEQKALWDVIGGRMGFVQFSGTETESAKSGSGVAQQLAHIYKELLADFDIYYIDSVSEERLKAQAQMMQSVLTYAHMSVSELRQRGVPEKIITFVEANRANLQRTYANQRRPMKELLEKAQQFVQNVKQGFNTTVLSLPTVDVPVERQAEYLSLLDTLHTQCLEIEPKLAMHLVFTGKEEPIKRTAAIICTVAQQKSYGASRFIVNLNILQKMLAEIKRMDGWAQRSFVLQQPQQPPRPNDAQGSGDSMEP